MGFYGILIGFDGISWDLIWLVVDKTPLKKYEFVSWDGYSQYVGKMFNTTSQNQKGIIL